MRAIRASGGYAGSTRRRIWPASSFEIIALLAGRGGATCGRALPMPARIPFGMQLMVHSGSTLLGGATSLPGVMRGGMAVGCRHTDSVISTSAFDWLEATACAVSG